MKYVRSIQVAAVFAAAIAGCAAPFPAPNLVDRPRVIAVLPSPMVAMAGETLTARAVFGGAASVTVRTWRVCVPARIDPFPEQRCADGEGAVAFTQQGGERLQWSIPTDQNELTTLLFASFVDANGNIPNITTALNQLRASGAELLIYVEGVSDNGTVVRAVKRSLFAIQALRYTPITEWAFAFAGQRLRAVGDECVVDGSTNPVEVSAGSMHVPQIEATMGSTVGTLDAAYFADGGDFPQRFEIAGLTTWVAPAASGAIVRHWVVVQRNIPRASGASVADLRACSFTTRTR